MEVVLSFRNIFHDQQRNEPFPTTVVELSCEVVRLIDDLLSLFGMRDVVIDLLFQVGVVVPYFDVVVAGAQASFHEPGFVARPGHHGDRIGGHDPPDVAGDIVALERHDEFRAEVGVERDLFCCTCFLGAVSAAGIRRVDAGIVPECFDEAPTLLATLNRSPEITRSAFSVNGILSCSRISKRQRSKLSNTELSPLPEAASPPPVDFRALMIVG